MPELVKSAPKKTAVRLAEGRILNIELHSFLPDPSALAKEYAEMGYPDRYAVIAESILGPNEDLKNAPVRKGLFVSLILRPSLFPAQAGLLMPLSATALAETLSSYTTKKIGLGWTSDVYCDGKKIGGVSIDGKIDSFMSYEYLVISFKVMLSPKDFPPLMKDLVRQVFEQNTLSSLSVVMAKTLFENFFPLFLSLKTPAKIMTEYRRLFALRGMTARRLENEKWVTYRIHDVDTADAALLLENKKHEIKRITTASGLKLPERFRVKKISRITE